MRVWSRRIFKVGLFVLAGMAAILGVWLVLLFVVDRVATTSVRLIVVNQGDVPIVGGDLAGDSQWRPISRGVLPGKAGVFDFSGTGAKGADYRLRLVRADSSRVEVEVGWLPEDWDISVGTHMITIIPNDTVKTVGLVLPMDRHNAMMHELRMKGLVP